MPIFISKAEGRYYFTLPPMVEHGTRLVLQQKRSKMLYPSFEFIDHIPAVILDSGEILEYAFMVALYNLSVFTQGAGQELKWFEWIEESHCNIEVPILEPIFASVTHHSDQELRNKMHPKHDGVIIKPQQKSHSADVYVNMKESIGFAIQAKNGRQKMSWNNIRTEMEKMGSFDGMQVYYIMAAMQYSNSLEKMAPNKTFIKLFEGTYFYDRLGNNYSFLLRRRSEEYSLISCNKEHPITKKERTPRSNNPFVLEFDGKILNCDSFQLSNISENLDYEHCFTVPPNCFFNFTASKFNEELFG
eukprot:gb/GECH01008946.1/.p1 GENE.gb/GECH01008946.1/~~gb/GECH01008946.1/.p1  ORF type:complete len:302 (+),score=30.62 gb/GECH01008946.1/:1-906(+)